MSAKPKLAPDKRNKNQDDDIDDPNRCFQHNYRIIEVNAVNPPRNGCKKCLRIYRIGTGEE